MLFGKGADPTRSQLSEYISDDEFGNLIQFSEYNRILAYYIMRRQHEKMTVEEYYEKMADLSSRMNVVLGWDPESMQPPRPADLDRMLRSQTASPRGSTLYTAKTETRRAIRELETDRVRQELASKSVGKIVYTQRTVKRKRGKKK